MAEADGVSLEALVRSIIGDQLTRLELSSGERRELAAMKVADADVDWAFHEQLATETGLSSARYAAE